VSLYTVYVLPSALQEIKHLPGHIRQRVKRAINALAENPQPPGSIALSGVVIAKPNVIAHRLKIEKWRLVYAIDETEKVVDVMTIRQRPPYDYDDLDKLIQSIL
jgi:mRNA interferase RelE/StbE